MAKDKERSINPAQQARKQEKNRALKKAKNEQQARRNEKFARRNPDRIQRQIDDLKALESSGEIRAREKAILADLERDLRAVHKAREALGEKAPTFGNARPRTDQPEKTDGRSSGAVLGKRGRDGERRRHNARFEQEDVDSGNETDESVRAIPMPRDTPPPLPRDHRHYHQQQRYHQHNPSAEAPSRSNPHSSAPLTEHKTTYSSAPQLRDLRKEATSRFVPSAVKRKQDAVKGVGGALLEPEEMDRLEATGYYRPQDVNVGAGQARRVSGTSVHVDDDANARRLAEEEARFERELAATGDIAMGTDLERESHGVTASAHLTSRHVEMEDIEDEDL